MLRNSINTLRASAIAAIAACALLALSAGTASAVPVKATWTTQGNTVSSGSLTITRAGVNPKTCTQANYSASAQNMSGQGLLLGSSMNFYGQPYITQLTCTGSSNPLDLQVFATADHDGGYRLTFSPPYGSTLFLSPYGAWQQQPFTVPFTNAVGATPSKVTFTNKVLGLQAGQNIAATGTLNLGSRTLTH